MAFGIYIHWPFCASKCPYCDFNSHVSEQIDYVAWERAYLNEIRYYASLTGGREVSSVFFGGGTPSLMMPATVDVILDEIKGHWPVVNDLEITLEANPTSVEAEKLQDFKAAGINRVSLGVQALDDTALKFLGRKHSADEAVAALKTCQATFERYSFDLIYARPQHTVAAWKEELTQALSFDAGHMSLYQLTIEPGTPFYTRYRRGDFTLPHEDVAGALYETTQEVMNEAQMPAYEVSNHAKKGQESRHNLVYWEYDDYLGIGPGAHGRLTLDGKKVMTRDHAAPAIWLDKVKDQEHGSHPYQNLSHKERFTEALMMGLRLKKGVLIARLNEEAGGTWTTFIDQKRLEKMISQGMLVLDDKRLRATAKGLQRLNGVLDYIL